MSLYFQADQAWSESLRLIRNVSVDTISKLLVSWVLDLVKLGECKCNTTGHSTAGSRDMCLLRYSNAGTYLRM